MVDQFFPLHFSEYTTGECFGGLTGLNKQGRGQGPVNGIGQVAGITAIIKGVGPIAFDVLLKGVVVALKRPWHPIVLGGYFGEFDRAIYKNISVLGLHL